MIVVIDHYEDIQYSVRRRTRVVHVEEVATFERCRVCPDRETCVRRAPNVCLQNDQRARSRVVRDNALRTRYLTAEEIKLISILELGFACTRTSDQYCKQR